MRPWSLRVLLAFFAPSRLLACWPASVVRSRSRRPRHHHRSLARHTNPTNPKQLNAPRRRNSALQHPGGVQHAFESNPRRSRFPGVGTLPSEIASASPELGVVDSIDRPPPISDDASYSHLPPPRPHRSTHRHGAPPRGAGRALHAAAGVLCRELPGAFYGKWSKAIDPS